MSKLTLENGTDFSFGFGFSRGSPNRSRPSCGSVGDVSSALPASTFFAAPAPNPLIASLSVFFLGFLGTGLPPFSMSRLLWDFLAGNGLFLPIIVFGSSSPFEKLKSWELTLAAFVFEDVAENGVLRVSVAGLIRVGT